MDLNSNVQDVILQNARARKIQSAPAAEATAPVVQQNQTLSSINSQSPAAPTTTEPSPTVTAVPEPTKPEQPKPETPKRPEEPVTPAPPEKEDFVWDAVIPDVTTTTDEQPVSTDIKRLSSALKLDVKNEDEFVQTVNQKFEKLKELESSSIETLPEQVKEIIDLAKKGGDWKSYTSNLSFDANNLDPVKLYDRHYLQANKHLFTNPDGSFNEEKLDQALDSIDIGQKTMFGNSIKAQIVQEQQQKKARILAEAAQQQERFQKGLGEAARELSNLLPQDKFGIKIEAKHSSYFYEGVANGSLIKKHLGDIDPSVLAKFDTKKLMKTLAIAELGERISQHQYKQGEVSGKKQLLTNTQNVQLNSPSVLPRPNEPITETTKTTADRLIERNQRFQPKGSL